MTPRLLALSIGGLLLALASPAQALTNQDFDADGDLNLADNCPYRANAEQEDPGGFGTGPDGIGTACQCGDVDDDGHVNLRDLAVLQRHLGGGLSPGVADEEKCSVSGSQDDCDSSTFSGLRNVVAEVAPLVNACRAAVGLVAVPDGLSAVSGDQRVLLDWGDVPSALVTGYHVYRSQTSGSGYVALTTSPVDLSSYEDATALNGTTYYYTVAAMAGPEGPLSSEISATPEAGTGPTHVVTDISSSTTWTLRGSPYIVHLEIGSNPITVLGGAMLTIEAGVDVQFQLAAELEISNASQTVGIRVLGSEIAPVTLRGTSATPGHWVGLDLGVGLDPTSVLDRLQISDAGRNGEAGLSLNSVPASVQLSHIDVTNTANEAIYLSGGGPVIYGSENLSRGGSAFAISAEGAASAFRLVASKVRGGVSVAVDDPAVEFAANEYLDYGAGNNHRVPAVLGGAIVAGGVFSGESPTSRVVLTEGAIGRNVRWPAYRYEVTDHLEVSGAGAPVLSLDPGVEVLVGLGFRVDIATASTPGGIRAIGTSAERVVFRASIGSPNPGHWWGLRLFAGITLDSALRYVEIHDAGRNGSPALALSGVPASVELRNGLIDDTSGVGITITGGQPVLDSWIVKAGGASYGLTADAAASPSLSNLHVEGGMQIAGVTVPVFTTITLDDYANGPPLRVPANIVGWVMSLIDIQGDDENSVVEVSGSSVSESAVWPAYRYVLLNGLTVAGAGAPTLTLDPGVELAVANFQVISIGSSTPPLPGGLQALGTVGQPIVFTGQTGGWSLSLRSTTLPTSALDHLQIEGLLTAMRLENLPDGIQLSNIAVTTNPAFPADAVEISLGAPVLDAWDVTPSADRIGIEIQAGTGTQILNSQIRGAIFFAAGTADPAAVITGNTFLGYGEAPWAASQMRVDAALVDPITDPSTNSFSPTQTGLHVLQVVDGTIVQDATWPSTFDYIVNGQVRVQSGFSPVLTIEAGTEIGFNGSGSGIIVGSGAPGSLVIDGTSADPVRLFRSSGSSWGGIQLLGETLSSARVERALIEEPHYVRIDDSSPTIRNSQITESVVEGVLVIGGSPLIESNLIRPRATAQAFAVRCATSGRPILRKNDIQSSTPSTSGGIKIDGNCEPRIEQNSVAGPGPSIQIGGSSSLVPRFVVRSNSLEGEFQNQSSSGIDARLNFWGEGIDPATRVSGPVLTNPWLESAFQGPFEVLSGSALPEIGTETRVRAGFSEAAAWTLTIPAGEELPEVTQGSGPMEVPWAGGGCGNPPAACSSGASYEYTLDAAPSGGGTASPRIRGRVVFDDQLPFARIDAPAHLETRPGETIDVAGLVSGHTSYRLEFGTGPNPSQFTQISSGGSQTPGSPIASWNTTTLTNGVYTLRLVATDAGPPALVAEDRVTVKILAMDPVAVSPPVFSPNADGVKDRVSIMTQTSIDTSWVIDILDGAMNSVDQISGSGVVIDEVWNGLQPAIDQDYTVRVAAVAGGVQVVSPDSAITVDNTAPIAEITVPADDVEVLDYSAVSVMGTANDLHPFQHRIFWIQSGVPTSAGPPGAGNVVDGLLGAVIDNPNSPAFENGMLTVRLVVEDAAGNQSSTSREIEIDRLELSNLAISPTVFDPRASETAAIQYDLAGGSADITVRLYASGTSTLADSLGPFFRNPGAQIVELWNGSPGGVPVPNHAYFVSVEASDGEGRSVTINQPPAPVPGPQQGVVLGSLQIAGSTSLDAFQNEEIEISYATHVPTLHNVDVRNASSQVIAPLRVGDRLPAGVSRVYWNGRSGLAQNGIHQGSYNVLISAFLPLERDIVFAWTPPVRIQGFSVNPYVFRPMYSELCNIRFTLERSADVSLEIVDPNSNSVATIAMPDLAAGEHVLQWNGRDGSGAIVATEGVYDINVTATDDLTSQVYTHAGVVSVMY